ncbi:hypothetical protein EDB84DRAFT_1109592 [Lactarius hengduanensis]|nr:hypothetical protein EDB84DRAFT_1109592 [Lactarius hengduanensis]
MNLFTWYRQYVQTKYSVSTVVVLRAIAAGVDCIFAVVFAAIALLPPLHCLLSLSSARCCCCRHVVVVVVLFSVTVTPRRSCPHGRRCRRGGSGRGDDLRQSGGGQCWWVIVGDGVPWRATRVYGGLRAGVCARGGEAAVLWLPLSCTSSR